MSTLYVPTSTTDIPGRPAPSSLGETRDLFLSVPAGALSAGTFVARVDLVKEHAFWFETRGAHPSEFELKLVSSGHVHVALSGGASRRSAKNKPKSPNIAVVWRSHDCALVTAWSRRLALGAGGVPEVVLGLEVHPDLGVGFQELR